MILAAKHELNLPIELLEPAFLPRAVVRGFRRDRGRQRRAAKARRRASSLAPRGAEMHFEQQHLLLARRECLQRKGGVFTSSQPLSHPSRQMAHGAARLIGQTRPICVQSRQPCMSGRGTTNQDGVTPPFHLVSFISCAAVEPGELGRLPLQFTV